MFIHCRHGRTCNRCWHYSILHYRLNSNK
jgi:hypothetical protein